MPEIPISELFTHSRGKRIPSYQMQTLGETKEKLSTNRLAIGIDIECNHFPDGVRKFQCLHWSHSHTVIPVYFEIHSTLPRSSFCLYLLSLASPLLFLSIIPINTLSMLHCCSDIPVHHFSIAKLKSGQSYCLGQDTHYDTASRHG